MLQTTIRRGELDRQIIFLKKVIGVNNTNEDEDQGWEAITTNSAVFAKVTQMKGREVVVADRVTLIQSTLFIVDYRTDVTGDNRIYFNSKVYNIISVGEHDSGRKRYLEIVAEILDNEIWT